MLRLAISHPCATAQQPSSSLSKLTSVAIALEKATRLLSRLVVFHVLFLEVVFF